MEIYFGAFSKHISLMYLIEFVLKYLSYYVLIKNEDVLPCQQSLLLLTGIF